MHGEPDLAPRAGLRSSRSTRLSLLVLSRHGRRGASSRLRVLGLLPGLATHGIDSTVRPFFDDVYLEDRYAGRSASSASLLRYSLRRLATLMRARAYDVVWIEKEALPLVPLPIERAMLIGTPYVVDLGDAWFLRYQEHRQPLVRMLLGGKLHGLVRRAQLTTVGNAYLESWARTAGANNVLQLHTPIDLAHYRPRSEPRGGRFTIGWIGSPSTAVYLQPLAHMLADLTSSGLANVHLVGSGAIELPGVAATCLPWDEQTEADMVARFDVGIVPLGDGVWEQAKSPYKLLQYMATGLPVVGSPVGAVREIIRHGVNGFLAGDDAEWRRALDTLRLNPEVRREMGREARRSVEDAYSLDATVPRLADALWQAGRTVWPALAR